MLDYNKLTFRTELRNGDEKRIREIAESVDMFYPDEVDIAEELAIENIDKGPDKSGYHFIICQYQNEIIGYTCFGDIPCTKNRYDLYWIIVHNSYRNLGIGKKLLSMTEESVTVLGGKKLYIETSSREPYYGTRQFYINCGYSYEAELKDYYDYGDNKIIYVKDLSKHSTY
jgi:ribosomal protein S18 acetylase RimI-like enzyme